MRTSNALKNITLSLLNKVVSLGLTFVVTPVIFKNLGKELYGINALIFQTLGYLGLAELGIGTCATIALYKTLASDDKEESNKILAATNKLYRYISIGIFLVGVLFSFFLNDIFSIGQDYQFAAQIAFLIYLSKSAISYFFAIPFIALNAAQKSYRISWVDTITNPLILIINYFVIKAGYDIIALAVVALIISIVTISIQLYTVRKVLPWINLKTKELNFQPLKETKFVFVDRLLVLGVFQTDFLFIAYFLGPKNVANYALYTTFFVIIRDIGWLALSSLSSGIGEMFAKNLLEAIYQLWLEIFTVVSYGLIILLPIIFIVFPSFIKLWVGEEALLPDNVLVFFIVNLSYLLIIHSSTIFVNAKGFFKERMIGSIGELIINVISSLVLIPKFGVLGAIMGTAIGHLSINSWYIPRLLFKSLSKSLSVYFSLVLKYIIIGTVVWVSLLYLNDIFNYYKPQLSWISLFLQVSYLFTCSVIITFILIFIFDPSYKLILHRIRNAYSLLSNKY